MGIVLEPKGELKEIALITFVIKGAPTDPCPLCQSLAYLLGMRWSHSVVATGLHRQVFGFEPNLIAAIV